MPFKRYKAEDRFVDGPDANARADAIERLEATIPNRSPNFRPMRILARITAPGADPGSYGWVSEAWKLEDLEFVEAYSLSHLDLGLAREINGTLGIAPSTLVELFKINDTEGRPVMVFSAPPAPRWVKLTAATAIPGASNRWTYTGVRQRRTATGFEDFDPYQTITGIVNSIEAFNSASGVQGHGVNITPVSGGGNYPNGYSVQPLHVGNPVVEVKRELLDDGTTVWTCQMSNADDGTCEAT